MSRSIGSPHRDAPSLSRKAGGPPRSRRCAAALYAVAFALGAIFATPAPAAAHAELVSSTPAANASLATAPTELQMTFTEPIDPSTAVVELLDPQQQPISDLGETTLSEADRAVTVALPELEPGIYTVSYQVVSTVDGHATAGLFAFLIDPSGTEAAPAIAPSSTSPSVDAPTIASRWVALVGVLVALGSLVMWFNAGRRALRSEAQGADSGPPWLLIGIASGIGFAGVALYLTFAARPIVAALAGGHGGHPGAGFPFDVAAPFGWTPFAIAMRVALVGSLAAFAMALGRYFFLQERGRAAHDDRRLAVVAAFLLAVALGGMSMAGHVAAIGGPALAAIDWAHLVSVAAWLGALPAALVLARRTSDGRRGLLTAMLRRHGRVALVAGPVTALTGLANSPLVLGASRDLVASEYGNLLVAKAGLLSVALGIGAINHLVLRGRGRANVVALVGAELAVAVLAVMAAATMVTIQPASARQPQIVTPPLAAAHLYGSAGPSNIHAAVSLPAPGVQTYQVSVVDLESGAPRDDVQKVFLTFQPPVADLAGERVELTAGETPGIYGVMGAYTPLEGSWGLEVTVRRAGALDETVTFELPVAVPAAPEAAPPPDTGVGVPAPLAMLWGVLPGGLAGWLPALVALAAVGASTWWARTGERPRWVPVFRIGLLAILSVLVLGVASRTVVAVASAPPADLAGTETAAATDPRTLARGERLYLANCASCHGADGRGDGPVATVPDAGPLGEAVRVTSDAALSYRIANGIAGTPMPAFAGILSEAERSDLIAYLRHQSADR